MRLRNVLPSTLLLLAACGPDELEVDATERGSVAPDATTCELGEGSRSLSTAGSLEGAAFWDCAVPRDGDEAALRFDVATGPMATVNGGSLPLRLTLAGNGEIDGRNLLVNVRGERGFFVVPAPPLAPDGTVLLDLYVSPTAYGGTLRVAVAIDDGTGASGKQHPGRWLEIDRELIPVKGGDVQFNVSWENSADLDLFVTDPAGTELFFAAPRSASGGELDLDSNAMCEPGVSVENVYWPTDGAPEGDYVVELMLYDACSNVGPTTYRGTLLLGGMVAGTFDGELNAAQEKRRVEITRFTWPPR